MSEDPARHALQLFEVSLELMVVVAPDLRVISVNPSWERILGYAREDVVGRPILALQHPDDVERTSEELVEIRQGRPSVSFENRYRHADGHYVWLRWSSSSAQDGVIYGAARDVTEERRATEEARAALARLEDAQRVANVGSWETNLLTDERFYTREMFSLNGLDPAVDEPWGMEELLERVIPEHRSRLVDAAERVRSEPGQVRVEYRMLAPQDRLVETVMEAVRDADGNPILLRGTTQDVTEQRESERRLAEAERVAGIGSFELRLSDQRLLWSRGSYRLFGMDPDDPPVNLDQFYALLEPEEVVRVEAAIARSVEQVATFEVEYTLRRDSDGQRIEILGRGEAYRSGDDTFIRGTVQDVTHQRRIARQQEEIARLGQMALAGTDLRELFDEVCRVVTRSLDTDMADVLAIQGNGSFAFAASKGFGDVAGATAIRAGQESIAREVLRVDMPLIVHDWHAETRFPYSRQLSANDVRFTAVLPIRGHGGPFGVLATHAREPGMEDAEHSFAFLEALAAFLGTAIERQRHEEEIANLAALRGWLVAENLEAEERARQRISEELHDGALQDLLAARQDLVEALAPDEATREEMLGYAREGVERAVRRLREAVHALHPVVLQHGGLAAAVQAAADQAARQGGFRATVTVESEAAGHRDELVMSLARELLTNAAKHARAQGVDVVVRREDGTVVLEVADDGCGLDAELVTAAPVNGHIGLASLVQRVEAVGGTLDIDSAEGRGTTVRASLPIS